MGKGEFVRDFRPNAGRLAGRLRLSGPVPRSGICIGLLGRFRSTKVELCRRKFVQEGSASRSGSMPALGITGAGCELSFPIPRDR